MSSPTLTNQVMEVIRQDILLGELAPGQKLVVADLKERYNVGASPIREALVQLSWRKYVKFAPQKGCWVAPVSIAELEDLFNTNLLLSRELLTRSIANGDESWELNILTTYHKLSRVNPAAADIDYNEWDQRHSDFHLALMAGSNSPVMMALYREVYEQIERYRHIWLSRARGYEHRYQDNGEHEAMMKAVLSRNTEEALRLLNKHFQRAIETIKPFL
ncbi:TPA: GntR family transcriptional regulator [Photobacterium damselae]|nr:GntR family transcriptional regulator [Photobacterium damselae]AWK82844.1 XRE family transcriptional regulator [Photobacterium damselae]MCG9779760.1 FCD domain-containing protein [Photobacterium damselae]MDC4169145.1 FCD domain-containing protein [Photobacterium damselae]OBU45087.1 XRE family transcriptional regulator [Photobacterium damselae]UJZ93593.1 FCD domain-containing protein [Photobacterium damselae subsp. damselae]